MMSPSLGSVSTGRSVNNVSSLIAGNFRWQLPEALGAFEVTTSPAQRNDSQRTSNPAKNTTDLRPFVLTMTTHSSRLRVLAVIALGQPDLRLPAIPD
jgi:hypothetical protein